MDYLKKHPLELESKDQLVQYFCKMHNVLNQYLEKKIFDCSTIYEVWGGECEVCNPKTDL
jgi:hypothetical protein